MNPTWKNFLLAEHALFEHGAFEHGTFEHGTFEHGAFEHGTFEQGTDIVFPSSEYESNKRIYPITDLGILTVAGSEAAKFLQGQITCNIHEISDTKSSLGALCNPKGRVISTFLLVKNAENFLLILPRELLASVQKRLQRYVLRSKVSLADSSDALCLIGLYDPCFDQTLAHDFATSRQENIVVNFQNRHLIIAEADKAQTLWLDQLKLGFHPEGSAQWRYLDMLFGIPWLTVATSEEFIPQMLNLDKLGGISYTKGCYTGQEIVARTHYLGKVKRELFLAECACIIPPEPNSLIIDQSTEHAIGKVLCAQIEQKSCKLLIVLQVSNTQDYKLRLLNAQQDTVTLINPMNFPASDLKQDDLS